MRVSEQIGWAGGVSPHRAAQAKTIAHPGRDRVLLLLIVRGGSIACLGDAVARARRRLSAEPRACESPQPCRSLTD